MCLCLIISYVTTQVRNLPQDYVQSSSRYYFLSYELFGAITHCITEPVYVSVNKEKAHERYIFVVVREAFAITREALQYWVAPGRAQLA